MRLKAEFTKCDWWRGKETLPVRVEVRSSSGRISITLAEPSSTCRIWSRLEQLCSTVIQCNLPILECTCMPCCRWWTRWGRGAGEHVAQYSWLLAAPQDGTAPWTPTLQDACQEDLKGNGSLCHQIFFLFLINLPTKCGQAYWLSLREKKRKERERYVWHYKKKNVREYQYLQKNICI